MHIPLPCISRNYIFAADNVRSIFIQIFLVGSVKRIFSARVRFGRSRHPMSFILVLIESA